MKVAIIQSSFLPWMGFFEIVNSVDKFVFYDDVQYTTRDWRNRNRIRVPNKWIWLTVPLKLEKSYFDYKICQVEIDQESGWQKKHLSAIMSGYKNSRYFDTYFNQISVILNKNYRFLIDLNYDLFNFVCCALSLKMPEVLFSQKMSVPEDLKKTDRLLWVLERIGDIDEYISGPAARFYLDIGKMVNKGIRVSWHEYRHPYYNQLLWDSDVFISHLSILDLLFNHGRDSLDIITNRKKIKVPDRVRMINPQEYKMEALV